MVFFLLDCIMLCLPECVVLEVWLVGLWGPVKLCEVRAVFMNREVAFLLAGLTSFLAGGYTVGKAAGSWRAQGQWSSGSWQFHLGMFLMRQDST